MTDKRLQEAQRKVVFIWMLENYVGGGCRIAKWNDFRPWLCYFSPGTYQCVQPPITYQKARSTLLRLHKDGVIERKENQYQRALQFRLPQAELDRMAAEAIAFYEACGYSQTEIRPRNKDVEAVQSTPPPRGAYVES